MKNREKNKKCNWTKALFMLLYFFMGAFCGLITIWYIDIIISADIPLGAVILSCIVLFIGIYTSMILNIILHEAGHLLFGLLTGYKLSSFRIGNLMWMKKDGKIRLFRLSIAGTAGQCLMSPPDIKNGKMPFVLYNLGGVIVNLVFSVILCLAALLCKDIPFFTASLMIFSVIGFLLALTNGIPIRAGVDNDGYNTYSLSKNSEAVRAFWIQMKINEEISKGVRLKDMPEDWFKLPSAQAMKNSLSAAIGVFACNRLMDSLEFEKAYNTMEKLLSADNAITEIYRCFLTNDRIYCELVSQNRQQSIDSMMDKTQQRFMNSMKKSPSVLRTQYAYALLFEKNMSKAEQIKADFEKIGARYPYKCEITAEREIMDYALQTAKERKVIPVN